MVTKEQKKLLREIKQQLAFGDNRKIANKLKGKSSYSEVCEVLKGTYYKDLVIDAALDVIAEKKKKGSGKISSKIKQKATAVLG